MEDGYGREGRVRKGLRYVEWMRKRRLLGGRRVAAGGESVVGCANSRRTEMISA